MYIPHSEHEDEGEIKVVKVPFHLFPAPPGGAMRETAKSAPQSPYSAHHPLQRTASNPDQIPVYPSLGRASTDARAKSSAITLPYRCSCRRSTRHPLRRPRASAALAVGVDLPHPARQRAHVRRGAARRGPLARQQLRRLSTSGATFVSIDEDPFVDAAQEQPEPRERTLL